MLGSELSKRKTLTVLGLSSGTSADGIDAALVRVSNSRKFKVKPLFFSVFKYPNKLRRIIPDLTSAKNYSLEKVAYLNYYLGELFAQAAQKVMKKTKVKVDLIGTHGQTIRHLPEAQYYFGKKIKATWQIGEADVIAKKTGLITVCDFRAGDVALSGQGAPLTPLVNYLLFGNQNGTAVLNLGGIANLSAWKKGARPEDILGFDCGPGNMVVDALVYLLFKKNCDRDGKIALSGRVNQKLLLKLENHKFFKKKPPKSAGREEFGERFIKRTLYLSKKYKVSKPDLITTVSELTVQAIWDAYQKYVLQNFSVEQLYVSGGGIYNRYFMKRLQELFEPLKVSSPIQNKYHPKALEAVSFAVLAYLTVHNLPANLPQVTGARRKAVLGKICLP